jgi:hypothetical protein
MLMNPKHTAREGLEHGDDDEAGIEQHDGVGHEPVQLRQGQLGVDQPEQQVHCDTSDRWGRGQLMPNISA